MIGRLPWRPAIQLFRYRAQRLISRVTIFQSLVRPRSLAMAESCLIGLISGLAAVALKESAAMLGTLRMDWVQDSSLPAWLLLPIFGFVGCWIAGWVVRTFAPEGIGSGIPHVKAVLALVRAPVGGVLAATKFVANALILGAGLPLGRQGPTVQVGAAVAAQLCRWLPTSPDYRRQMIAAGAGAGLAAGFNAPLAGVMFVVEELLRGDMSRVTLGPAILASFVGAVVARTLGGEVLPVNLNEWGIATGFRPIEIPAYILLGILAGVLGAFFNRGILASLGWTKRRAISLPLKMAIAGAISGLTVSFLPEAFWNYSWLREGLLLTDTTAWLKLVVFGGNFALTLIAFSSGAPGGLFAPSLVLGAVLGSWVGWLGELCFGVDITATYSLVGMGALFGAVSRVPMTAIAIVFEMTADFNVVLPLMIGVVISYLIADRLDPGSLYGRLLELQGIRLPSQTNSTDLLAKLTAEDVMHSPVETLDAQLTVEQVLQAFNKSHHRGFPVVDGSKGDGKNMVGIVTQSDIADWSKLHLPPSARLRDIMTHRPVTVTLSDSVAEIRYMFSRYRLSRVPVMEGRRVVGIVTRSDLLRVEANRLGGEASLSTVRKPSYLVYARRSPNTGRGRLLLPLSNPKTASALVRLALAIAKERDYELECLHTVVVPAGRSPSETPVDLFDLGDRRTMLDYAFQLGRQVQVDVHVQVRTTHDPSQAILETIEKRHIDLVLLEATDSLPDGIFGRGLQRLGEKVPCELAILRWSSSTLAELTRRSNPYKSSAFSTAVPSTYDPALLEILRQLRQWVVFLGGGPNAKCALRLLPGLTSLDRHSPNHSAGIHLCQISTDNQRTAPDPIDLVNAQRYLQGRTSVPITLGQTFGKDVLSTMLSVSEQQRASVLILGISRENFMQQAIRGNLPQQIMGTSDRTVILARDALHNLE
ncbi:MAG: chloride channel protein [Cyanophyceae cyanobacterium]